MKQLLQPLSGWTHLIAVVWLLKELHGVIGIWSKVLHQFTASLIHCHLLQLNAVQRT